ncbi:hypothetical protein ABIE85_001467 [Bradyrhizobium diazoefficiens]
MSAPVFDGNLKCIVTAWRSGTTHKAAQLANDVESDCSVILRCEACGANASQDEHLRVTVMNWCSRPVGFPNRRHTFVSSRLISPELLLHRDTLRCQRAQGRPGAGWHPRSTVRRLRYRKLHSGIQVKPNTRPSLRSGLTAYAAFSPGSDALLPPSPCGSLMRVPGRAAASPQDLAHRPRAPGRHGFAVRKSHRSCAR